MKRVLLYDDSASVPLDIGNLLGVTRFSDIYYRKRSLDRWASDICQQAGIQFLQIGGDGADHEAIRRLTMMRAKGLVVMYMPAFVAFGCPEDEAALFLRKLSLTRTSLWVEAEGRASSGGQFHLAVTTGDLAHSLLESTLAGDDVAGMLVAARDDLHALASDVSMIDMRDPLRFTDYLTSNFDVRFFNSVQTLNDFVLVKRSSETEKLRRECNYYGLLPPALQMFFIQPYDFAVDNGSASYKMERLFVPDMALQWIHGSFDKLSFERLLDKLFYYLSLRSTQRVSADNALEVHQDAYRTKVADRLDQLKRQHAFEKLRPYLDANFGSVDALFNRYFSLFERLGKRAASQDLRIGHGDLCFSNILYSKTTGLMRFIDPRGADSQDDLYVSPFYDLAKLSHSIAGNYDFINYGLFRLDIGPELQLQLVIEPGPPEWARSMFDDRLQQAGYAPALIRLFEASLFLSMVPLHIDSPKKVLAFLVNAHLILSDLEQAS